MCSLVFPIERAQTSLSAVGKRMRCTRAIIMHVRPSGEAMINNWDTDGIITRARLVYQ